MFTHKTLISLAASLKKPNLTLKPVKLQNIILSQLIYYGQHWQYISKGHKL